MQKFASESEAQRSTEQVRAEASEAVSDAEAAFVVVADEYDPDTGEAEGRVIQFATAEHGHEAHIELGAGILKHAMSAAQRKLKEIAVMAKLAGLSGGGGPSAGGNGPGMVDNSPDKENPEENLAFY